MTKQDKNDFLKRFEKYKSAVMLLVAGANFSEGIDIPKNKVQCVIVVGLPLSKPDLETRSLIDYYDRVFGRGWDYGYIYPAFNKTLQMAGRCIRSEKDRGVIVYLDERYAWPKYKACFPAGLDVQISKDPLPIIDEFFK